ncbi:MAG: hypothetical protein II038_16710 [Lachnospiraceae bacterium]|nr:hypothetical protein [Lachnospiraceae bacterium]
MKCPQCGAELRFDPATQLLVCDYCGGTQVPSLLQEEVSSAEEQVQDTDKSTAESVVSDHMADVVTKDTSVSTGVEDEEIKESQEKIKALEPEDIKLVEYVCPNCGGTLYSVKESVNGFCSFCGSQVMLQSRFSSMKPPKGIIPFIKTKEECKKIYTDLMNKNFFAPDELKDPEYLEQFRGIYMPYHVFNIDVNDNIVLKGKKAYRKGDYFYTENYTGSAHLSAYYHGLSYDASSTFSDHFSEAIAPYDAHKIEPFDPDYLAGFYADMPDVSADCYSQDATDFAMDQIVPELYKGWSGNVTWYDVRESIPVTPQSTKAYTAFFPVWFLSYKKNDRVAYAVINGVNGKISCDTPINTKKFMACCFLLAIPIYIILAFIMPALTPKSMISFIQSFGCICAAIMFFNIGGLVKRERHFDDRGYIYKFGGDKDKAAYDKSQKKDKKNGFIEKTMTSKKSSRVFLIVVLVYFGLQLFPLFFFGTAFLLQLGFIQPFIILVLSIFMYTKGSYLKNRKILFTGVTPLLAASWLSLIVTLIMPYSDPAFYTSAAIIGTGVIIGLISVVEMQNLLHTRPLPQLSREGGDVSAPV